MKVVVSKKNFRCSSIKSLFEMLPDQINYNVEQRLELIEENLCESGTITWGIEWESLLKHKNKVIEALKFLDREDFEYAHDLFKSPIGVDGNGEMIEFRTKPNYSLISAIEEVKGLIKQFLKKFPDVILYPCGNNSIQINIGNAQFSRRLKFILDISIYSIVRKLNLIRARTMYSNSSIRIKGYTKNNYLWEYRPLPSMALFIPQIFDLIETIVNKFYKGETFNITIDSAGIGWLEKPMLFIQKMIKEEADKMLFNLMEKGELKLDERIIVDNEYIDRYFEWLDECN